MMTGLSEAVPSPTRVFILDDHAFIRRGLGELIGVTPDLAVAGEAHSVAEALRLIPEVRPDVALLDIVLPDGSGVDVCREIRSACPEVSCLMLTSHDDDEALFAAVMAGASGYLTKQIQGTGIVPSIRRAAAGESLLSPSLARRVVDQLRSTAGATPRLGQVPAEQVERLTDREWRIVDLIADGDTNRQIAERLNVGERAIKTEVSVIFAKLALQRRSQAGGEPARSSLPGSPLPPPGRAPGSPAG